MICTILRYNVKTLQMTGETLSASVLVDGSRSNVTVHVEFLQYVISAGQKEVQLDQKCGELEKDDCSHHVHYLMHWSAVGLMLFLILSTTCICDYKVLMVMKLQSVALVNPSFYTIFFTDCFQASLSSTEARLATIYFCCFNAHHHRSIATITSDNRKTRTCKEMGKG